MATFDSFFAPLAPGSNIHIGHALGVLAEAAYTSSVPSLQAWANIFAKSTYGVILTPDQVTPNLMYVGDANRVIIAVPGTTSVRQMINNIRFSAQRTNADFGPGRMHSFFLWCAESIIAALGQTVNAWPAGSEVCFVGHSLGGAVAQLLADWTAKNTSYNVKLVCTFNSPRVGDPEWARRSRTFPTHLYYGNRDMICETPLGITPSATAWQTDAGFFDAYEHRNTLIEIDSGFSILPSWIAITEAKAAEGTRFFVQDILGRALNSRFMHYLGRSAAASGIISWVQPFPAWYWAHSMRHMLDAFEEMPSFRRYPEYHALFNLRAVLDLDPTTNTSSGGSIRGIVPPGNFSEDDPPPPGPIASLPPVPNATRVELLDTAFEEDGVPELYQSNSIVSASTEFFDAFFRQAAAGFNPLAAGSPLLVTGIPSRPNWLFSGRDRRMMQLLYDLMTAIDARDWRAWDDTPTASISTRELVIDDATESAWQLVRDQVGGQLALYYEPTP